MEVIFLWANEPSFFIVYIIKDHLAAVTARSLAISRILLQGFVTFLPSSGRAWKFLIALFSDGEIRLSAFGNISPGGVLLFDLDSRCNGRSTTC